MAQDGPKRAPGIILPDFVVVCRPFLGPSWAILGPRWPFSGGPRGHLEADFGLGRLASGVQGGQKLRCPKHLKNLGKIKVVGRFLKATSLQKACKLVVWRSCCGLEGLKRAAWMSSWLQDGLGSAKLSPRWPNVAPRSGQQRHEHHRVNPRGGSGPPGGSKILKIRRSEDPKLRS